MTTSKNTTPMGGFELITPDAAKAMLGLNTNNRSVTPSRVNDYADEMRKGKWQRTHEGIAFGADGVLYDGQHRLEAIVKANVPITLYVTRGLDPDARVVINTGRSRSAVDNLAIVENIKLSKGMGAAFNVIWGETIGQVVRSATAGELRTALAKHRTAYNALKKVFVGIKRGVGRSGFIAAFIFAHKENPEKVLAAAQKFFDGTSLVAGSPMYLLREKALRGGKHDARADFRRGLAALAAELDGTTITRIVAGGAASEDSRHIERFTRAHA